MTLFACIGLVIGLGICAWALRTGCVRFGLLVIVGALGMLAFLVVFTHH
jgi:hypothetical protein